MARYTAYQAADTVGSKTETVPPIDETESVPSTPPGLLVVYADEYIMAQLGSTGTTVHQKVVYSYDAPTSAAGYNDIKSVWVADPSDTYTTSEWESIATNPLSKTETLKQFFFKEDDKIKGSEFDDMLCGWAGKDKMWGYDGEDQFYYGKGMGKDEICDFEKKKDEIVLDDSAGTKFKKVAKKAKYNENKEFTQLKFGDGDKLKIYGIDTKKELKKALSFDDFTDFA